VLIIISTVLIGKVRRSVNPWDRLGDSGGGFTWDFNPVITYEVLNSE